MLSVALTAYAFREPQLLVGASGGIMGFVGATVAVFLRGHARERSAVATHRLKQALTLVGLQTVLDFLTPQLSMLAHALSQVCSLIDVTRDGRGKAGRTISADRKP